MPDNETQPRVYDFIPDPTPSNFPHLPFPDEGDTIWVGDDMGTVIERSFDPMPRPNGEGDDPHAHYAELKIIIKM